jgi:uncharacterized protein (TIGR00369 family)
MPVMSADELIAFLRNVFPQSEPDRFEILELSERFVSFRYHAGERDLRPGGTVSGPTMMALADTGTYLALLAMIGPVALAVTTSLNINFLRKPPPGELRVDTSLLKLGKRLAVGEVSIFGTGAEDPVAHATVTYSIPG